MVTCRFVLYTVSHGFYGKGSLTVVGDCVTICMKHIRSTACVSNRPLVLCTHIRTVPQSQKAPCFFSGPSYKTIPLFSILCCFAFYVPIFFNCEYHDMDFIFCQCHGLLQCQADQDWTDTTCVLLKGDILFPLLCKGKLDWDNPVCQTPEISIVTFLRLREAT